MVKVQYKLTFKFWNKDWTLKMMLDLFNRLFYILLEILRMIFQLIQIIIVSLLYIYICHTYNSFFIFILYMTILISHPSWWNIGRPSRLSIAYFPEQFFPVPIYPVNLLCIKVYHCLHWVDISQRNWLNFTGHCCEISAHWRQRWMCCSNFVGWLKLDINTVGCLPAQWR